jgi:hypothetical protein
MNRQHGERSIDRLVVEGQRFRRPEDHGAASQGRWSSIT